MANKSYRVRLPTDVIPTLYDLRLEPDLDKFSFDGNVKITCDVAVATDTISVNQKELVIASATFTPTGGSAMSANVITMKVKEMTATFVFDEVLPTGEGILEINFRGTLNDQMAGFYRSKYKDLQGNQKVMATTQFEAIDARRSFPCWDEPGVKAVFVVTMIYPANLLCLSNMPESKCETLKDGRRSSTFMPTPKMSTYLLAYCVGDYEFVSAQTKDGVLCRVFCTPGGTAKCAYSLRKCVEALEYYNEFFGIPYPLPKLDMIAIPDFSAGAMENWGLVTYREVELLCDEATVSANQKKRICTVVAHELAHQWFGNLVTMEWWDDLWLNEGFANWMQTYCTDKLHPEWNIWQSYVGEEQQNALRLDALRSSHPIQVPIGKAETVEEVFDAISYCKGGSVVRMVYAVLGEKDFQSGLQLYFKRHQYGNTETTHLWQAWKEASGKPVDEMMGSWTSQMGYPVLKVLNDPITSGADAIEVEQSWFLGDGSCEAGDVDHKWLVPVFAGSDKKSNDVCFMGEKKQQLPLNGAAKGAKWLKLNLGQHVPTRVLYPTSMIESLASNIAFLAVEDRIGLLSDTYALCKAGLMEAINLGKLLGGFTGETNDKVWAELITTLSQLDKAIKLGLPVEVADAYKCFAGKIVAPAFKEVGWDAKSDDSDNRKKLRNLLVDGVAKFCSGDAEIVAAAVARTNAFLAAPADPASLSADVRAAALTIAMQAPGYESLFDKLIEAHNDVADNAIRKDIYKALGECPSAALRTRFLKWGLSEEVRGQDMIYTLMGVLAVGREGADQLFGFLKSEYDAVYDKIGKTSMMLFGHVVKCSGMGFGTEEKAAEVEAFWKAKPVYSNVQRSVDQTVESILANSKFVARLKGSPLETPQFWADAAAKLS